MNDSLVEKLKAAVESLHGCLAVYRGSEDVSERFGGQVAWERSVATFALTGHLKATLCYAWSERIKGSEKERSYAVLRIPPVETAKDAVRASIVQAYREEIRDAQ